MKNKISSILLTFFTALLLISNLITVYLKATISPVIKNVVVLKIVNQYNYAINGIGIVLGVIVLLVFYSNFKKEKLDILRLIIIIVGVVAIFLNTYEQYNLINFRFNVTNYRNTIYKLVAIINILFYVLLLIKIFINRIYYTKLLFISTIGFITGSLLLEIYYTFIHIKVLKAINFDLMLLRKVNSILEYCNLIIAILLFIFSLNYIISSFRRNEI